MKGDLEERFNNITSDVRYWWHSLKDDICDNNVEQLEYEMPIIKKVLMLICAVILMLSILGVCFFVYFLFPVFILYGLLSTLGGDCLPKEALMCASVIGVVFAWYAFNRFTKE